MAFSLDRAVARGKALAPNPAFMGNDPVSVYSPGASRQDATLSQREAPRHLEAYGGREAIDHVHDCIGLYADAVATSPYHLEKADGTKLVRTKTTGTPPDHEVGPAEIYDFLDNPNQYMLWDELVSLLIIDWMLVGNAYWYKLRGGPSGRPVDLYRLAPSHVKIVPGQFGPKSYEYQPPGVRQKLRIDPSDIVHFRRPNPHSAYYGMGVIQGSGRAMDMELAITDTVTSYYENKADPSLIVSSERRVGRDVFNKLRAQMRARTAGPRKAGELLVLEAGLKADTLGASASDALFEALSKMSRDRVFQKFHVNPMLLGLMDESNASNKVSDVRREFDNYTIRPFVKRLQGKITAALLAEHGLKLVIDQQQMLPPEEAIKVGESVGKVPGVKIREVRKQYIQFGIEESTGDPDLDEELLNLPLGELGPDGQPLDPSVASGPDKPLSSEPGRPPKPSNTSSIGNAAQGKALDDPDPRHYTPLTRSGWTRAYREQRAAEGRQLRVDSGEIKSFGEVSAILSMKALEDAANRATGKAVSTPPPDNRLPGEQRPDDTFAGARAADINNTTAAIAAGLREASVELERGLLDTAEGKAFKSSDIVSRLKKSPAWATFKERVTALLEDSAAQAAASGVMHSGVIPDDEIDYDAIAKSTVHRPDGVRSIIATLKERISKRVKEAREADAERTEIEAAIRAVTSEWAANQAVTIADSEATEAYNEGTLTAAEMAGIDTFFVVEEDDAPDAACQEAKDSVWDLKTARARRKEHPNCRRAFIPLAADTVAS